MDIRVVSTLWLLWIVLLWPFLYKLPHKAVLLRCHLWGHMFSFPLEIYLGVNCWVIGCLCLRKGQTVLPLYIYFEKEMNEKMAVITEICLKPRWAHVQGMERLGKQSDQHNGHGHLPCDSANGEEMDVWAAPVATHLETHSTYLSLTGPFTNQGPGWLWVSEEYSKQVCTPAWHLSLQRE